jgi:hypothetical protein
VLNSIICYEKINIRIPTIWQSLSNSIPKLPKLARE